MLQDVDVEFAKSRRNGGEVGLLLLVGNGTRSEDGSSSLDAVTSADSSYEIKRGSLQQR